MKTTYLKIIIRAWWHHVTKGRWLVVVPFFLAFWVVHKHLVSYGILLLILLSCHLFVLSLCLDLLLHSLFHSCKRLVDNTYPKGYTIDNEGGIVIELKVLCYRKVSFNFSISIELLSHVNNMPLLFTITSSFEGLFYFVS
jgi:hypothetical protein